MIYENRKYILMKIVPNREVLQGPYDRDPNKKGPNNKDLKRDPKEKGH